MQHSNSCQVDLGLLWTIKNNHCRWWSLHHHLKHIIIFTIGHRLSGAFRVREYCWTTTPDTMTVTLVVIINLQEQFLVAFLGSLVGWLEFKSSGHYRCRETTSPWSETVYSRWYHFPELHVLNPRASIEWRDQRHRVQPFRHRFI